MSIDDVINEYYREPEKLTKDNLEEIVGQELQEAMQKLFGNLLVEKAAKPPSPEVGVVKDPDKFGDKKPSGEFLNIDSIISMFVARTETDNTETSLEESFEILRQFNKPGNLATPQELNDYLVSFFQSRENTDTDFGQCTDIGTISKRILINSAYSKILTSYNAASAGFVNEAFLAKLLGGDVVTTNTKIGSFNNIADLEVGGIGISLKTKARGVKGSPLDLITTLGIPHIYTSKGKADRPGISTVYNHDPVYPNGLYYVFFGKPRGDKTSNIFSITTALITRESVIEWLEQVPGLEKNQDGYYVTNHKLSEPILKTGTNFLKTSVDYRRFKPGSPLGIAAVASEDLIFENQLEFTKLQAATLGEELTKTLNLLNGYFSALQKSIMTYASDPSPQNLESFQQHMARSANFEIKKLLICT